MYLTYYITNKMDGQFNLCNKNNIFKIKLNGDCMLNIVWPIFIILSFSFAIFTGNLENLNNSIFESTNDAIKLSFDLLGSMCLWSGIMNIASSTSLVKNIAKALNPVLNFLFPTLKNNKKIKKEISMNMVANILGLGNAATPLGLKAMKSMQDENNKKDTLSDNMMMFIVINTASIQLIPTTVIAIRNSLGSNNPTSIVFPTWIATIIAAISGIFVTKLIINFTRGKD